ncbi:hypothetical protein BHE89_19005 [Shigella sp. FC1967]|nr:hypothetical protein BHE89_19005 [Shigella sp. FC1967]
MKKFFKVIYKASPFAHVTICFRRTSLAKIGFYPVDYPLNEDIALWFSSFKKMVQHVEILSKC